jgi:hypothetical protein
MSLRDRAPESDIDEEGLANEYRESVQYDGMEELGRTQSVVSNQDIQAQLAAAATPLEFQATLETKFASYDSYCNLFHYILNSEGPVDLEVPNVGSCMHKWNIEGGLISAVLLGVGRHRRVHLPVQLVLQLPPKGCPQARE